MTRQYLKRVSLLLLVGTTALYPTAALADPVSIGGLIISGALSVLPAGGAAAFALTAAAGSLGFISIVGNVALAGASLAISFLTSRRGGAIDPGRAKEEIVTESTSEIQAVGTVRISGVVNYGNNNHPKMYRHLLHSRGVLSRILKTYVNGREVIIGEQDRVISSPWSSVNVITGAISNNYLTIKSKPGDGTETAYTELVTDFPDTWTANHWCRGIFQSLVTAINPGVSNDQYLKLYGASPYPKVEHVAEVGKVYDPRLDSTVTGGSGTHRADDPSTWEWSDNGALGTVYILLQYPNIDHTNIDWEKIIETADWADTLVSTRSGNQRQSVISGVWPSMNDVGSTMQQVLLSTGLELRVGPNGLIYVSPEYDNPNAEVTFTQNDTIEMIWQGGPEAVERPNVCSVKYYSPEQEYSMTEINMEGIAWAKIDDEVDRWGEKRLDIELPFCPSAAQAQRIARRRFQRARADRGSALLDMSGMAAWGSHYADLEVVEGETSRCAISSPRCSDKNGEVQIDYVVYEPLAVWNTSTDEADPPPVKVPETDDTELATPAAPIDAFWVQYADGAYETRVVYASVSGADGYLAVLAEVDGGVAGPSNLMTPYALRVVSYEDGDRRNENLRFRVQAYDEDGSSNFSDPLDIVSLATNTDAPVGVEMIAFDKSAASTGFEAYTLQSRIFSNNIINLKVVLSELTGEGGLKETIFNGKTGPRFFDLQGVYSDIYDFVTITQTVQGGATLVESFENGTI